MIAVWEFGWYMPVGVMVGLDAGASLSAHDSCRQAMTSPRSDWTPRKLLVPAASSAIMSRPEMRSSLTPIRVVPCIIARSANPTAGRKWFDFSMSR